MRKFFILVIKLYQHCLSPFFGGKCRFTPSCSDYAIEAIKCFGVFRGSYKSVLRIMRCHPFHPGGYDPLIKKSKTNKD